MRRQPLLLVAVTVAIASFVCRGAAVAQDDNSNKNARFYHDVKSTESTSAFQTLKQVTAALSDAGQHGDTDEVAKYLSQEAFEHSRQGGAVSGDSGVAIPAVVVSTAVAAAVPIEQLRQAAPNVPDSQRPAVGGLLKYIPEVKKESSGIDKIFVPTLLQQQARDQARMEQYRQSAAPAKSNIEESTKKEGGRICVTDR